MSGVPGQPNHFYFGSVDGGVWQSHNAGRTWTPVFDQQPVGSIGALAVAPSNPKVIYAGTGQATPRYDVGAGLGVFKGKVWRIGLMGESSRRQNVILVLNALEIALAAQGMEVARGAALVAADNSYNGVT